MWSIHSLLNAAVHIQTAHLDAVWRVNSLLKWQRQKCGGASTRWTGWWWTWRKWVDFHTSSSSLPLPLPLLFSPFLSHLLSPLCGYFSWHFLSFCFIFCAPLPSTGHSPNKPWQRIIIHKYVVEHSGCSNTEKVRHPAKTSSPPNAGFPLAFISMAGFIIQWVHILFHRALPPCQEKCLVVNKHQTRACKCWLLPERCQLHRLLWQVTSILLVESKNGAFPNRLLYCLNESIFTMITGHHCVTHLENVLWY